MNIAYVIAQALNAAITLLQFLADDDNTRDAFADLLAQAVREGRDLTPDELLGVSASAKQKLDDLQDLIDDKRALQPPEPPPEAA